MSAKALSLMNGMLRMPPGERLGAIDCLAHPYFDEMRTDDDENLIEGYNHLKTQQLHSAAIIQYQQNNQGRGETTTKSRVSVRSTM